MQAGFQQSVFKRIQNVIKDQTEIDTVHLYHKQTCIIHRKTASVGKKNSSLR